MISGESDKGHEGEDAEVIRRDDLRKLREDSDIFVLNILMQKIHALILIIFHAFESFKQFERLSCTFTCLCILPTTLSYFQRNTTSHAISSG